MCFKMFGSQEETLREGEGRKGGLKGISVRGWGCIL